ncbi:MAG: hypothetical protein LBP67_04365 [Bacteroidales bacterium]|jgi:hypothetical protein|nr:hypothetical protein [Bacteroidales bacterium]
MKNFKFLLVLLPLFLFSTAMFGQSKKMGPLEVEVQTTEFLTTATITVTWVNSNNDVMVEQKSVVIGAACYQGGNYYSIAIFMVDTSLSNLTITVTTSSGDYGLHYYNQYVLKSIFIF